MARAIKLKIGFGGIVVSADVLPEMAPDTYRQIVCKKCSPKKTKLHEVCLLMQRGFAHDMYWSVMRCKNCGADWAVPYRVEHTLEEVMA